MAPNGKPRETDVDEARKTYMELARIAHDAFVTRRNYEWKLHIGFWTAIGAIVYFSTKSRIPVLSSTEVWPVAFAMWFSYAVLYTMMYRGHHKDKHFKHFYMGRADGTLPTNRADEKPLDSLKSWFGFEYFWWAFPFLLSTGTLIVCCWKILNKVSISVGSTASLSLIPNVI